MADLNLKSFDQLYPIMIRKYQTLVTDPNASVIDKINTIMTGLNATGKLTNDVVKNWNTVMEWVMNDGLTTDVSNKLDAMVANGTFTSLIDTQITPMIGDISTLTTVDKTNLVHAVNELQGKQVVDEANIATNSASLVDKAQRLSNMWVDLVQDYQADKTGVTDSATAIQNAINAVQSSGTGVIFFGGKSNTFLINSTITFDPSKVTLLGFGAKIQYGNANTTIKVSGVSSYQAYSKAISGLELIGAGKTVSGGVGVTFSDNVGGYADDTLFQNVIIHEFYTGITWSNNAWLNTFDHCAIYNCTYDVDYPSGLTNSGEEITFNKCALFNSTNGVRNKSGEMVFNNCSIDYISNRFVDAESSGRVTLQNCHIEGSSDSDFWFYTQDSGSAILMKGGSITLTGNKSAYQIGKNTNLDAGIHLDSVYTSIKSGVTYGFQTLITGVGSSRNLLPYTSSGISQWCVSVDSQNYLINGGFETANFNEWTSNGTVAPVVDTTLAHTGVNSLKLNSTSTKYINMYKEITLTPGQKPRMSFWALASFNVSVDSFKVIAQYYDSTGAQIGSPTYTMTFAVGGTNPTAWTKYFINPFQPAVAGTAKIRFTIQQASSGTTSDGLASMWFDDIIITVE